MKDSEFRELLNLYLDHEISAADAVRLETEVANNPERRRIYRQYCMMQKACKSLSAEFVDESTTGDKNVVAFEAPQRSYAKHFLGAGIAAAACLALGFTFLRQGAATSGAQNIASEEKSAVVAIAQPAAATRPVLQPAFSTRGMADLDNPRQLVPVAYNLADAQRQFAWMQNVQATNGRPVSAESLVFKADVKLSPENRPQRLILDKNLPQAAFEYTR